MLEDGDRDDPGLAGDVAAHHQDDPELPQGVGEAEHPGGDESPPGHGYRHGEERVEGAGAEGECGLERPASHRLERPLDRLHHEGHGVDRGSDDQALEREGEGLAGHGYEEAAEGPSRAEQEEEVEAEHGGREDEGAGPPPLRRRPGAGCGCGRATTRSGCRPALRITTVMAASLILSQSGPEVEGHVSADRERAGPLRPRSVRTAGAGWSDRSSRQETPCRSGCHGAVPVAGCPIRRPRPSRGRQVPAPKPGSGSLHPRCRGRRDGTAPRVVPAGFGASLVRPFVRGGVSEGFDAAEDIRRGEKVEKSEGGFIVRCAFQTAPCPGGSARAARKGRSRRFPPRPWAGPATGTGQ